MRSEPEDARQMFEDEMSGDALRREIEIAEAQNAKLHDELEVATARIANLEAQVARARVLSVALETIDLACHEAYRIALSRSERHAAGHFDQIRDLVREARQSSL